uniref:hypothetical protein n=1 Tax=Alistipes shahii TaxID=328814 RepID=UPI003FED592B
MYELFRYVVFTKSPFFQKTAIFFIIFPKKTTVFRHTPEIFSHFSKNSLIFHEKSPKCIFSFSPKQAEIKTIFQPFNHTGDSIRAGPSGNAAGGEIRKNSAALLFS